MKKRLCALFLAAAMLWLCGCASVYSDDYYYSEEYTGDMGGEELGGTGIENMSMLKAALISLISSGQEHAELLLTDYIGTPQEDVAVACYEIKTTNPVGAYAVKDISFETNRIVSYYVVSIDISYSRSIGEIESIVNTSTVSEFTGRLLSAVRNHDKKTTLKIYSSAVNEDYIRRVIEESYFAEPAAVVARPQITISSYPQEGANRIYEVMLDFGADAAKLKSMNRDTLAAANVAAAQLGGLEGGKLLLSAAEYLGALCVNPHGGAFADTAYAALTEGSSSPVAVALAFKVLCGELGFECVVVKGTLGAEQEHYWNIVKLEGAYYHVDVSAFASDPAEAFLLSDEGLWGPYVWETADYPACTGELSYWDFAEPPAATESEQPANPPEPETTPAPEETAAPSPTPGGGESSGETLNPEETADESPEGGENSEKEENN